MNALVIPRHNDELQHQSSTSSLLDSSLDSYLPTPLPPTATSQSIYSIEPSSVDLFDPLSKQALNTRSPVSPTVTTRPVVSPVSPSSSTNTRYGRLVSSKSVVSNTYESTTSSPHKPVKPVPLPRRTGSITSGHTSSSTSITPAVPLNDRRSSSGDVITQYSYLQPSNDTQWTVETKDTKWTVERRTSTPPARTVDTNSSPSARRMDSTASSSSNILSTVPPLRESHATRTHPEPPSPPPRATKVVPLVINLYSKLTKHKQPAQTAGPHQETLKSLETEFPDVDSNTLQKAIVRCRGELTPAREEVKVHQLMGFGLKYITEPDCRRALVHCQGKLDRAGVWLLGQDEEIAIRKGRAH